MSQVLQFEQRGIVTAQAFFDELEKIAVMRPQMLQRLAQGAGAEAKELATMLPWHKRIFGASGKALRESKKRGKRTETRAANVMKGRERQAYETIQSGQPAERARAMQYLRDLKNVGETGAKTVPGAFRRKKPAPKPLMESLPKGIPQSQMGQAAMVGGGGAVVGGGGILAAQQAYRQRQQAQNPYAQYQ